jgi:pimeloyl-ACP methyl ester carboxylesterase
LYHQQVGSGLPLLILHGLFGSSDNWMSIAKTMADDFDIVLPDLRNHGNSPHSSDWTYEAMAADVVGLLDALNIEKTSVIGHSMGGKAAMTLVAKYPERIEKLVVVDIAPKKYPVHHRDILNALRSIDLKKITKRSEADEQLAERIGEKAVRQFLLKNLTRDDDNNYIWKLNLKVIDEKIENIGEALSAPNEIPHPALFIRGEHSDYISADDNDAIKSTFPKATLVTIKEAGHWIHAEKPEEFTDIAGTFLKS